MPISKDDAARLAENKPHGVRVKYMAGCRCMLCRAANSRYSCERAAAQKRGDGNGLVSSREAMKHIRKLSREGIGYKAVAEAAKVPSSTIFKIKTGVRKQIRMQTRLRILSVTKDAYNAGNLLDADPTWKQIDELLEEGFTKAELARRLGLKSPAIQFKRFEITGKTKSRVDRFYKMVMAE